MCILIYSNISIQKNPILIENYIMISRYNFSNLHNELIVGTFICVIVIFVSAVVGYMNFKKKNGEIINVFRIRKSKQGYRWK